ncbi:acetyltransferase [Chitinibacter tainanensis]|uniref:acetyltransferase n=1 Tax=Chitinibacter tainanensis TaxID=230667 RepID=UPI00048BB1E9|nr:acetyltransferase [Chitinibacter tainanensis]
MKRLAILGASGHGKVIADTALLSGWEEVIFFDDMWPDKKKNGRWSIIGDAQALIHHKIDFDAAIVAVGNNSVRLDKTLWLKSHDIPLATIIHPSAVLSPYVRLGYGSVVLANAVVQIDTVLGIASLINTSASVDHDCVLEDGVHICPGARLAGGVRVGSKSWIGIGSSVKQSIQIGANVTVGAGAAVITDISDSVTVAGVPARNLACENKC